MDVDKKRDNYSNFLVQNTVGEENLEVNEVSDSDEIDSIGEQNEIDNSALSSRDDKNFVQCSSAGNIYSEEELNEGLQQIVG
jgi:hypothetical protein